MVGRALVLLLLVGVGEGMDRGTMSMQQPMMMQQFENGVRGAPSGTEHGPSSSLYPQSWSVPDSSWRMSDRRPDESVSQHKLRKGKATPIFRCPSTNAFPSADSYAYTHNEDLGFSMFLERRCKWVYFIRHAEAVHNIAEREHELGTKFLQEEHSGWTYWDAALTPRGKEQCNKLRTELRQMESFMEWELCVVSPLTRTLETAKLTVGAVRQDGPPLKMIATEMCRERITMCPADSRRPKSILEREFPEVDFSQVIDEEDTAWRERKEDDAACKQRGIEFLQWLARRPESCIAVVTHSGFLKRLFEQFGMGTASEDLEELRRRPANCEMRGLVLCAHHEVEGGIIAEIPSDFRRWRAWLEPAGAPSGPASYAQGMDPYRGFDARLDAPIDPYAPYAPYSFLNG